MSQSETRRWKQELTIKSTYLFDRRDKHEQLLVTTLPENDVTRKAASVSADWLKQQSDNIKIEW